MDVRRLELLRELADRGSVTAVAAATHRTPSAVSQQLKQLEREAGIPLTERSGRGIILTAAGRELAKTATAVAVAIERAEALWDEYHRTPQGVVSLLVFPTAGRMLVPGMLRAIADTPGLRVACSDRDGSVSDYAELTPDYDIVLADSSGVMPSWRDRGLLVVPLMREGLDIAMPAAHPLAARESVSPEDVIDEPWIGVPTDYPYDHILQQIEAVTGRPADVVQRFADNGIVEAMIAAGLGIGILPRFTTHIGDTGIVTRPLTGVRSTRVISALLRPDRAERQSVQRVLDALLEQAGRIEAGAVAP
jgi:DNA-binding transcriptional LysR family regulator